MSARSSGRQGHERQPRGRQITYPLPVYRFPQRPPGALSPPSHSGMSLHISCQLLVVVLVLASGAIWGRRRQDSCRSARGGGGQMRERPPRQGSVCMLIDRYRPEDVFARVPELADQTDPVLVHLDRLLDDDQRYQQVRGDLVRRYRLTAVHGRHSTPAEVLLRLLVMQHLYSWSYAETVARVADSLVLRWFCRVYFQHVPTKTTLLRWAQTIRPVTLQALVDRVALLALQARVTPARKLR